MKNQSELARARQLQDAETHHVDRDSLRDWVRVFNSSVRCTTSPVTVEDVLLLEEKGLVDLHSLLIEYQCGRPAAVGRYEVSHGGSGARLCDFTVRQRGAGRSLVRHVLRTSRARGLGCVRAWIFGRTPVVDDVLAEYLFEPHHIDHVVRCVLLRSTERTPESHLAVSVIDSRRPRISAVPFHGLRHACLTVGELRDCANSRWVPHALVQLPSGGQLVAFLSGLHSHEAWLRLDRPHVLVPSTEVTDALRLLLHYLLRQGVRDVHCESPADMFALSAFRAAGFSVQESLFELVFPVCHTTRAVQ